MYSNTLHDGAQIPPHTHTHTMLPYRTHFAHTAWCVFVFVVFGSAICCVSINIMCTHGQRVQDLIICPQAAGNTQKRVTDFRNLRPHSRARCVRFVPSVAECRTSNTPPENVLEFSRMHSVNHSIQSAGYVSLKTVGRTCRNIACNFNSNRTRPTIDGRTQNAADTIRDWK